MSYFSIETIKFWLSWSPTLIAFVKLQDNFPPRLSIFRMNISTPADHTGLIYSNTQSFWKINLTKVVLCLLHFEAFLLFSSSNFYNVFANKNCSKDRLHGRSIVNCTSLEGNKREFYQYLVMIHCYGASLPTLIIHRSALYVVIIVELASIMPNMLYFIFVNFLFKQHQLLECHITRFQLYN